MESSETSLLPPIRARIPSLDGLRALSFFIVFIAHMGFMDSKPGGFGVSIFFAISGYLITNLLINEYQATGTVSLRSFYLRRTLRIFPAMYFALAICFLLAYFGITSGVLKTRATWFELLYLQNYAGWWGVLHGDQHYFIPQTSPMWSLCVEEHFYLLFPVAFLFLLRKDVRFEKICRTLFYACFIFLAWRLIAIRVIPTGDQWCYRTSDSRMDSILWGSILACAEQVPRWRSWVTLRRLERLLVPVSLMLIVGTFVFHDLGRMTTRFTIQGIALMPVIFYVTQFPESLIGRILNLRFLVHIGKLSYALYLIHYAMIDIVQGHTKLSKPLLWFVSASASYLAALVIHWSVERPFESLRARLRGSKQRMPPPHREVPPISLVAPLQSERILESN